MKCPKNAFARLARITLIVMAVQSVSWAQKPIVRQIDKANGSQGETVTLVGDHFGATAADLAVFFGAAQAGILTVGDKTLELSTPPGTTFGPVTVINKVSGLSGASADDYFIRFNGDAVFSPANLGSQVDIFANNGLYDLCLGDFDNDGLMDVATANDNANAISLLKNGSTIGSISMANSGINIGTRSIHISCGDLNGDALPDLVASEGGDGDRIFIFKNNGGFAFSMQSIKLTGVKTKQIGIADLDGDGKPELAITDQGSGRIVVLRNQSTTATVAFAAAVMIPVPGTASTDGIQIKDLNGDLLPEILVGQFLTTNGNLFVLQNGSTVGSLVFNNVTKITVPGTLVNLKFGDLDGDGRPDIAATQVLSTSISVLLNQSDDTKIAFADPVAVQTDDRPWGLDLGDLDGDGKLDVVVASFTKKSLTVLNNTSSGSLSFARHIIATTYLNRNVKIGDMDGDGKPDITFTSIDDNNLGIPASDISVIRNKACMVPVIPGNASLTLCSGALPYRLSATEGGGVTYQWTLDGAPTGANTSALDANAAGVYAVTAVSEGGSCSKVSNNVIIAVVATAAGASTLSADTNPVCVGDDVTLTAANVAATAFNWEGPDGYTASGSNVVISDFAAANAGRYYVDVVIGTCIAERISIVVEAKGVPNFTINYPGIDVICQGQTKTLTVSPIEAGHTYQWFLGSNPIGGATASTFVANATGDYFVRVGSDCPMKDSETVRIIVAENPVADFNAPAMICLGQAVSFTNQSTSDPDATPSYNWDFGDGQSSTVKNPAHTYSTVNTFNVMLTISYNSGICSNSVSKSVSVVAAPALEITNPDGNYIFCPGQTLKLGISGIFSSVTWSTSATTPGIDVTEAGTYSVEVLTTSGCTLTAEKTVETYDPPIVAASADPVEVNPGASSTLHASGAESYVWEPAETLDDPASANPIASPLANTTYTVTGTDANGCTNEAAIEVSVKGEAIVNLLEPSKFFSPNNGDTKNPYWVVVRIDNYPQCGVSIFDDKGVRLLEAKPYLNDWDGTVDGRPVPDGVYYYQIKCEGDAKARVGSITILR